MNAVEIEQALSDLAEQPSSTFDAAEFPFAFLAAFGNKETTIKRLRAGVSNKSDLGGVLQTSNIHILTCDAGQVPQTLKALKDSPATAKAKAKFGWEATTTLEEMIVEMVDADIERLRPR